MSKTKMTHEEQDELRKNAPIPEGMKDYRDCVLKNKHNDVLSNVTGYEVCDSGVILWSLDTKSKWYTQNSLERNWKIIESPMFKVSLSRGDDE
jgi:hypothetical protein|tara:strand:+ start:167 stop:445 length:279 start_codon:yes stop_codon:yes gene_type:complete